MSTKVIVALITVVLVALVIVPAVAEETYCVVAVVVSYETSSLGDLEVEVVDTKGNVWAYFSDEAHIGDLVVLTVFDFEGYEDDEIIDVTTVDRLDTLQMVQWLRSL